MEEAETNFPKVMMEEVATMLEAMLARVLLIQAMCFYDSTNAIVQLLSINLR